MSQKSWPNRTRKISPACDAKWPYEPKSFRQYLRTMTTPHTPHHHHAHATHNLAAALHATPRNATPRQKQQRPSEDSSRTQLTKLSGLECAHVHNGVCCVVWFRVWRGVAWCGAVCGVSCGVRRFVRCVRTGCCAAPHRATPRHVKPRHTAPRHAASLLATQDHPAHNATHTCLPRSGDARALCHAALIAHLSRAMNFNSQRGWVQNQTPRVRLLPSQNYSAVAF